METVQPAQVVESTEGLVTLIAGQARLISLSPPLAAGSEVYACIRAEDVILVKGKPDRSSPRNCLSVVVVDLTAEGPIMRIDLDAGFPLTAVLTKQACEELALQPGEKLTALIKAPQIHLIQR
jgi:molybdate transport system ATP-binding protein